MEEVRRLMALRAGLRAKAEQYEVIAEEVNPKDSGLAAFARGLRLAASDVTDAITKLWNEMQKEAGDGPR